MEDFPISKILALRVLKKKKISSSAIIIFIYNIIQWLIACKGMSQHKRSLREVLFFSTLSGIEIFTDFIKSGEI